MKRTAHTHGPGPCTALINSDAATLFTILAAVMGLTRALAPSRPQPFTMSATTSHPPHPVGASPSPPPPHGFRIARHISRLLRVFSNPPRRFSAVSCPPPSIEFQPFRPESGLNSKCSLFTSFRGPFAPVPATNSRLSPLCYQTQTPVHPLHWVHAPPVRRSL